MKLFPREYVERDVDRAVIATSVSFFVNAFFAILKLCIGFHYSSVWFIINAFYYILLSVARGEALRKYSIISSNGSSGEKRRQLDVYRHGGILICLLSISYLLVCMRMYFVGDTVVYRGYVVYGVIIAAVIKIGFAISGIRRATMLKSPIFSSIKTVNFFDATVSTVVALLELLRLYGNPKAVEISSIFGVVAGVLLFLVGLYMINKGKV